MKYILAISLFCSTTMVFAAEKSALTAVPLTPAVTAPPAVADVKGNVLEVKDVEAYTYLRLKTKEGETWAAVNKSAVKVGVEVTIENVMILKNFESKTLKKTFPSIIFGTLAGSVAAAPETGGAMAAAHSGKAVKPVIGDVHVSKAVGENARTVVEIVTKAAKLNDKTVLVRGKVVKYSAEIMDRNWVHISDGTGSAEKNTNDVLVTTKDKTQVGEVVTVKGVVRTKKDFGSGYSYDVMIEDATLQK
jgi:hypothetical protein